MTPISSQNLTIERSTFQSTDLYLAKYEPKVILRAQINSLTIAKGAITIPYNNSTGLYSDVKAGMTMYIGSARDLRDYGKVRVKSIVAGSITVAPDSDIDYANGLFLTVVEFYEIWPVFPKAVLNTGTLTTTFYKDEDIAYSNQNTNFDPVIVMGPHYADLFDTASGTYFTATGSYTVDGASIISYHWTFPSGSVPATSTLGTPGYVQLPNIIGSYTVDLTISGSNSKSATAHRHVVLLPQYHGHYGIIRDWEFQSLDGDIGSSGFTAKITVREQADEFKDGDLIMIFAEDKFANPYHNNEPEYISFGGYPGRERLLFVGYIDQADTDYDYQNSKTVFIVRGPGSYLANKEMFSVQMTDASTPADWTEINNLTIDKAINHYVRWHSTILNVADFRKITPSSYGDLRENIVLIQKGELISNLNSLLKQRIFGYCMSDRQGTFWNEVDLNLILTGTRPASVMTFIDGDWLGDIKIGEKIEQPVSNVLIGGEAYNPPTVTGTAYLSRAPGELQTYVGKSITVSGLTLTDQTQLNAVTGLYYAKQNNRFPDITLDLANNMRNIDILPQEFYNFTLLTGSTSRRFYWNPKRLLPRKISYTLDNFTLKQTIQFETETYGPPGDTIIIPTVVPDGTPGDCPDCNPCDPTDCICNNNCPPSPGVGDGNTVYVMTARHIGRTRNFLASSPNWTAVDSGLAGTLRDFILEPYNPVNEAWCITSSGLYYTSNLNATTPTWTSKLTAAGFAALDANWDTTIQSPQGPWRVMRSISDPNYVMMMSEVHLTSINNLRLGLAHSHDKGLTWHGTTTTLEKIGNLLNGTLQVSQLSINKVWVTSCGISATPKLQKSTDHGHTLGADLMGGVTGDPISTLESVYDGTTASDDLLYVGSDRTNPTLWKSTIGGGSWTNISPVYLAKQYGPTQMHGMVQAVTSSGTHIWMIGTDNSGVTNTAVSPHRLFRSTDGGSNWTYQGDMPVLAAGEFGSLGQWPYNENWLYCLYKNVSGVGANDIYYSSDGGASWSSKLGDWATTVDSNLAQMWPIGPGWHLIVPVWIAT